MLNMASQRLRMHVILRKQADNVSLRFLVKNKIHESNKTNKPKTLLQIYVQ